MNKVLDFDNSAERYLRLSNQEIKKGNLVEGLVHAFNAWQKFESKDALINIARIYKKLEIYELSNEFWFLYLDRCSQKEAGFVYEELSMNYFYLKDSFSTSYYLHKKLVLDGDISDNYDKDALEYIASLREEDNKRKFTLFKNDEYQETDQYKKACALLDEDKLEEALEIFEKIPVSSVNYAKAMETCACIKLALEDKAGAYKTLSTCIKNGHENLSIYFLMLNALLEDGEIEKAKYYYSKAVNIPTKDALENYKLGMFAIDLSDHENVKKYMGRVLKEQQYNLSLRHVLAMAYINTGDYVGAYNQLKEQFKLFPEDEVCKYFLDIVGGVLFRGEECNVSVVDYPSGLDRKEEKRRIKIIEELEKSDVKKQIAQLKKQEVRKILEWGTIEADESVSKKCAYVLCSVGDKFCYKVLKRALLIPTLSSDLKGVIVFLMASFSYSKKTGIVLNNMYRQFKPRKVVSNVEDEYYQTAYALALSRSLQFGSNKVDKLAFTTRKVLVNLKNAPKEKFSRNEIALLVFHLSGISDELSIKKPYNIFSISKSRFNYIIDFYNNLEGEN